MQCKKKNYRKEESRMREEREQKKKTPRKRIRRKGCSAELSPGEMPQTRDHTIFGGEVGGIEVLHVTIQSHISTTAVTTEINHV
jgi:hypothetical protein